jgi:hypothetical protein
MVWAKRRFNGIEYIPYMDRLEALLLANAARHAEFIFVSVKTNKPLVDDYYVGLPEKTFLPLFDGFETVSEDALPKIIDTCLVSGDQDAPPFSRFTFRHRLGMRS